MTNPVLDKARRRPSYVKRDDVKGVTYREEGEPMGFDEMEPTVPFFDDCEDMHVADATIVTSGADCPIKPNAPWYPDEIDLDERS